MASKNGPEPEIGSYVYASMELCPTRVLWVRKAVGWSDKHGCVEQWCDLVDPIDALPPEKD